MFSTRGFTDTIYWAQRTGLDGTKTRAQPAFAAATAIRARIERGDFYGSDDSGNQFASNTKIATTTTLAIGDRVWLTNEPENAESAGSLTVKSVVAAKRLNGTAGYVEAYL